MLLDSRSAPPISGNESGVCYPSDTPDVVFDPVEADLGSYTASIEPTATLLVSKLPAILFSQTRDLEPLFYPYGSLKQLQIVGIGLNGTLSVLVQYHSTSVAQEAKDALHGQNYVNFQVEVQFLRSTTTPFDLVQASRAMSPFEKFNFSKSRSRSPVSVDGPGGCRQFESYDSPGTSDLSDLNKRTFFATPSFDSPPCDRNGVRLNSSGSRYILRCLGRV
jgi:hypothetical protein